MASTILMVDDEDYILDMMSQFLEAHVHCKVITENSCDGAKVALEKEEVDLVLLDVNMGGLINPLQLVDEMKASSRWKNTPIVMLSSMAQDEIVNAFKKRGVHEYFNKLEALGERKEEFVALLRSLCGVAH